MSAEHLQIESRPTAISVVSAADNNYAMPLAVTIRSAIEQLSVGELLDTYILDGGLSAESRTRLCRSWCDSRVRVHFLAPDMNRIADLKTENHLNLVTYLRLFMPEMLPAELERVIFLDADLLVLKNLGELWRVPLNDAPIAAVCDYFRPHLNTREALGRATMCDHEPHEPWPVPNYGELGLRDAAGYFNAGVMLVNLKYWRDQNVFAKTIELTQRYRDHVRYCDQYALNILFSDKWHQLDLRWNQNCNVYNKGQDESWPLDPNQLASTRANPWIVHFTWIVKPWHTGCTHPFTRKFFQVVDRTAWRGWRPPAPPREPIDYSQMPQQVYQSFRRWRQKQFSPLIRTLKHRILGRKKAA